MRYEIRPVYARCVMGVQEHGCVYKFVWADVQLMAISEVRAHRAHLVGV